MSAAATTRVHGALADIVEIVRACVSEIPSADAKGLLSQVTAPIGEAALALAELDHYVAIGEAGEAVARESAATLAEIADELGGASLAIAVMPIHTPALTLAERAEHRAAICSRLAETRTKVLSLRDTIQKEGK